MNTANVFILVQYVFMLENKSQRKPGALKNCSRNFSNISHLKGFSFFQKRMNTMTAVKEELWLNLYQCGSWQNVQAAKLLAVYTKDHIIDSPHFLNE